jgi:hypothetical protein
MMFGSLLGAVLAHKQVVIAAVAISGLLMYAFPTMTEAAHRSINIDRSIQIPCLPYCNVANQPQDIDRTAGPVHIQLRFSFVNFR